MSVVVTFTLAAVGFRLLTRVSLHDDPVTAILPGFVLAAAGHHRLHVGDDRHRRARGGHCLRRTDVLNTGHELGAALGVALASLIAAADLARGRAAAASIAGFTDAYTVAAVSAVVAAVVLAVALPAGRPRVTDGPRFVH